MDYYIYIIIAIIISIILCLIRPIRKDLDPSEKSIITGSIGWCLVIYGLMAGFSINIFYNRYLEIRNTFITEITNLQLTYRYFKTLPNSENVILSMKNYLKSIFIDLLPNLKNKKYSEKSEQLYRDMDNEIIKYLNSNPNIFVNNILIRMGTDQKIKRLVDEINDGEYYINILIFLFIIILIPLWLTSTVDKYIQFIIDACILIILISALYICIILNNVFDDSPISIKMQGYQDLLDEIEEDEK